MGTQKAIGQRICQPACGKARHDRFRQPAEILHQGDTQRDGEGPQFADGKRLYFSDRPDKTRQFLDVESAVGVGNNCPGDSEYAGITFAAARRSASAACDRIPPADRF